MAGPRYSTPPGIGPSLPTRRFTLEEANRAIPLVRRIVEDIVRTHESATRLQASLESISETREQIEAQETLQRTLDTLGDFVDELAEIGCELKDPQVGLIDFVGRHQGRDIYLCWKLGEERITHWHELHGGFAGRQPVSLLEESSPG